MDVKDGITSPIGTMALLLLKIFGYAALLATVCVTGDHLLLTKEVNHNALIRVSIDSLTHGMVGFLSWCCVLAGVNCRSQDWIMQVAGCGCLAMAVDVDHFLAAQSLDLKAALSLARRPPFHNSSLIPFITLALWLMVRTSQQPTYQYLPWIFFTAWTSHHIRDATRRGLWFAPLGSTAPLSRLLYIGLTMILPVTIKFIISPFSESNYAMQNNVMFV